MLTFVSPEGIRGKERTQMLMGCDVNMLERWHSLMLEPEAQEKSVYFSLVLLPTCIKIKN